MCVLLTMSIFELPLIEQGKVVEFSNVIMPSSFVSDYILDQLACTCSPFIFKIPYTASINALNDSESSTLSSLIASFFVE